MMVQRSVAVALLAVVATAAAPVFADLPQTRMGSIFPPGGQAGTTVEVRFSGQQDLEYDSVPRLFFSHSGITGEPDKSASGRWQNDLFRVTIASDVPPGRYDVRLGGYYGVSNPRSFCVESVPVTVETADPIPAAPAALAANNAFYGRIASTADVDVFTFAGEAGQTVVFRCDAASLDSPLQPVLELTAPDGRRIGFAGGVYVGEALLPIVLSATGTYRLQVTDASYRGGSDFAYRLEAATRPVVASVWPPAGEAGTRMDYTLYGYNLPEGESVEGKPLLVRRDVAITLPSDVTSSPAATFVPSQRAGVDGFDYVFREGGALADPVPIYLTHYPPEQERENDAETGQGVFVPMEIAGRFEKPGDVDHYILSANADEHAAHPGEPVYIEVFAKRYGSPADPVLSIDQVTGPDGKPKERRIATTDDTGQNIAPGIFDTATDDPVLRFDPPEGGTYRITLRDRYSTSRGDHSLFYRLSIRKPQPDFRLVAVPVWREKPDGPYAAGGVTLRKGENVALPIYAFRFDGFNGPIRITATDLPAGLTTAGVTIAEGQSAATLILTAADDAATWQGPVKILGEADLPGAPGQAAHTARYEARIGAIVRSGPNTATESRLAGPIVGSILDEPISYRLDGGGIVTRVGQGSQVLVPLETHRRDGFAEQIAVAATGLPNDAKVAVEVKPFDAGSSQQVARLLVDKQAPPRTYVVAFNGTSKIDYGRFPLRLARAKSAQAAAAAAFTAADAALKQVTTARDQAKQTLATAEAIAASAAAPVKAPAVAAVEAAKNTLARLEATLKAADDVRKQAEVAKQNADKAAGEVGKASAVQKVDYSSPAPTVALTIVPSPVDLAVTVPNGGQVKRAETLEIKLTAKRQNGFAGPITLSLALPPGITGLAAEPVTMAADQTEATLRITAAGDAAEGDVAFPAIRALAEHNGPVQIDLPVGLKVVP